MLVSCQKHRQQKDPVCFKAKKIFSKDIFIESLRKKSQESYLISWQEAGLTLKILFVCVLIEAATVQVCGVAAE